MEIVTRLRKLRSVGVGLLAQGMTIVAGVLPAFFGLDNVLVFILIVNATSTIVAGVSTLAITYRLPTAHVAEPKSQSLILSALLCTAVLCLGTLGVGVVLYLTLAHHTGSIVAGVAILLAAQAAYMIGQAVLVAADLYPEFMTMRFTYAVILLVGNTLLCLLAGGEFSFVIGIALAYGLAAAMSLVRPKVRRQAFSRIPYGVSVIRDDIRGGRALIVGQFFNGLSMQSGALASGTLGAFAPAWALATRVTNGFQTIAGQIVTPAIDTTVARGIRTRSRSVVRSGTRNGLVLGSALGLGCLAASTAMLFITDILPDSASADGLWTFFAATAVYNCLNIAIIPIDRILPFLGRTRFRMVWDIFRAATIVPAIFFLNGETMLVVLTIVSGIAFVVYVRATAQTVRRYQSHKRTRQNALIRMAHVRRQPVTAKHRAPSRRNSRRPGRTDLVHEPVQP